LGPANPTDPKRRSAGLRQPNCEKDGPGGGRWWPTRTAARWHEAPNREAGETLSREGPKRGGREAQSSKHRRRGGILHAHHEAV